MRKLSSDGRNSAQEAVRKTTEQFRKNLQEHGDDVALLVYAQTMANMCLGLVQGIAGKSHVDDFVTAWMNDAERIVITPQRVQ